MFKRENEHRHNGMDRVTRVSLVGVLLISFKLHVQWVPLALDMPKGQSSLLDMLQSWQVSSRQKALSLYLAGRAGKCLRHPHLGGCLHGVVSR